MTRHIYQNYTIMTQGVMYNPADSHISYRYVIMRRTPSLTHYNSTFDYLSHSEALTAAKEHVDRILAETKAEHGTVKPPLPPA